MTQPVVIGVDLGTTSCKADAFSISGEMLGHGVSSCTVNRPYPNWVEQDCSQYWESAVGAIRQALASIEPSAVIGLACCGHTPSLVLLDGDGRPVRPAIIWQDSRASAEASTLEREIRPEQWKEWLGLDLPRNASYPPARLRWLRTHEPAALSKTRQLLQPKDYLNYLLTGKMGSDYWGSKGLVHLITGEPIEAYRRVLGVDPALAPACRHPHHLLGSLSAEAAHALGLAQGVPVATGWTDALCGMLGTGALAESGSAFDIAGTSEIVGLTSINEPVNHAGVLVAPILDTDLRVVYGPTQTSGGAVDWFVSTFLSNQKEREIKRRENQSPSTICRHQLQKTFSFCPTWKVNERQSGTLRRGEYSLAFRSNIPRPIFCGRFWKVSHSASAMFWRRPNRRPA
jgi:xylulokinase